MTRYFAVVHGRRSGIYTTWEKYQQQIQKYRYPEYREFKSLKDAKYYLKEKGVRNYYNETDWCWNNAIAYIWYTLETEKTKISLILCAIIILVVWASIQELEQEEISPPQDDTSNSF